MKLSYDDICSFPNKLKLDDSSICTKLLIMEHKITNRKNQKQQRLSLAANEIGANAPYQSN